MILRTSIVVPIALGAAIHAILWWISEPDMLFSDFHKAYFPAAGLLWEVGPTQAWPLPEPGVGGFVNVPVMAWLFVPLLPLGSELASWAFLVLGVVAVAGAWHVCCVLWQLSGTCRAWLAFAFLVNGPLVNSLKEGNTTHFVLLLLVAGLAIAKRGKRLAAGSLLGLAMLIKLPLLLLLPYLVFARHWRIAAAAVAVIAAVAALSLAVHGYGVNRSWYIDSILPYLGRTVAAFNVQSIDAFLFRLQAGPLHLLDWTAHDVPIHLKLVRIALVGSILLAGAALLWIRKNRTIPGDSAGSIDPWEYSLVVTGAVTLSPLSWTHYYLLLLLTWSVYFGSRDAFCYGSVPRRLLTLGFVLSSLPVVVLEIDGSWLELYSRTLQSAWLFGGILMLIAIVLILASPLRRQPGLRSGSS
jgi:hypothetical protein